MKVRNITASFAMLMSLTGATSAPVHLKLSGGWSADYATNSCRITGEFADGPRTATLVFERIDPRAGMSMLVLSNQFSNSLYGTRNFAAYFLPYGKAGDRHGQSATGNDAAKTPGALWSHVGFENMLTIEEEAALQAEAERAMRKAMRKGSNGAPEEPEPPTPDMIATKKAEAEANLAAITAIQLMEPGKGSIVLDTGPLKPAIHALEACTKRQLAQWGIDPAVDERITKRAKLNDWWKLLNSNDYPIDSIRKGQESVVAVRMLVDANGRISDCTPITSVSPPTFGKVVCSRFMRGTATPAELEDGTKVPSYIVQHVAFRLP